MIIGDPQKFAVELELDENCGGTWLYGRLCYWIHNKRIGNYEKETYLCDVIQAMKWLPYDNGNRMNDELFALNAQDFILRLHHAFSGTNEAYEKQADEETWARFLVDIPIDVFAHVRIFLIEDDKKSRIIIYSHKSDSISEYELLPGEFDRVISQTQDKLIEWFEIEEMKLQPEPQS